MPNLIITVVIVDVHGRARAGTEEPVLNTIIRFDVRNRACQVLVRLQVSCASLTSFWGRLLRRVFWN